MATAGNMTQDISRIGRLLRPDSVAIVGASATPGSLGASLLGNLERNGFVGDIHLVNPKRADINGRPCLPTVNALPEGVDVAVLAIPQAAVLDTVRGLAERKVGGVVIFSAGFAEAGAKGLAQQGEIARIAQQHGMIVEGPNCLGCINYVDRIPLTFVEVNITPDADAAPDQPAIGIVSQSGAMMTVLCTVLGSRNLPLSYAVSTGNEAASHAGDYIGFLLADPRTRVITMIAEQFRHPQRVLELARRARELGKTIVLLHPGKTSAARESALTHTGALAGDYALMRTKLQRAGVIFAETLEELGDMSEIAVRCNTLPEPGLAVAGESGAFKALMLDLAGELHLALPAVDAGNAPALRAAMPAFVGVSNPLDLTAQGLVDPDLYYRVLEALFADERFNAIVLGLIQGDPVTCGIKLPVVCRAVRELHPDKPLIVCGLDEGADVPTHFIAELRALGVPYFPSSERALRAVKRLSAHADRRHPTAGLNPVTLPLAATSEVVPEYQTKDLLTDAGIGFAQRKFVRDIEAALAAAAALGYPVALKAQSAQLSHKSEAGGVILNVSDAAELKAAWARLYTQVGQYDSTITLDGVLVEAMGAHGLELIVGARNDPQWGPAILVGMGGVVAEAIKDVRLMDVDLSADEVLVELEQLKGAALFHRFRGGAELDLPAVANLIVHLGRIMLGTPAIAEIDLNPVVVYPAGQGVLPLDALMRVSDPGPEPRIASD